MTSPSWPRLPPAGEGQAIGLLGGSFNPPHDGHLHLTRLALQRFRLDFVWWLVTPGNPLKSRDELRSLEERLEACRHLTRREPKVRVTHFEADVGVSRSYDTLRILLRRAPRQRFVWLMGADNLASFHRWHGWRRIAGMVPIGVIDRPGYTLAAAGSPFVSRYGRFRVPEEDACDLARRTAPAWSVVHGPRSDLSSTWFRRAGLWPASGAKRK